MAKVVPYSDDQSLQHFLIHSTWDEGAVIEQIAHHAVQLIGGKSDTSLLIDEICFPKNVKNPWQLPANRAAVFVKSKTG